MSEAGVWNGGERFPWQQDLSSRKPHGLTCLLSLVSREAKGNWVSVHSPFCRAGGSLGAHT